VKSGTGEFALSKASKSAYVITPGTTCSAASTRSIIFIANTVFVHEGQFTYK